MEYGVSRLSVVSMRAEANWHSLQVNQMLFGEHYLVLERETGWLRIQHIPDDVQGWIPEAQHHSITYDYFVHVSDADFRITLDTVSTLLYRKSPLPIMIGSVIPIGHQELFALEEQLAFGGDSKSIHQRRDAEFIQQLARKFMNAAFLPGGKTPFGLEIHSFIQLLYRLAGYRIGRHPHSWPYLGVPVKSPVEFCVGDILYFRSQDRDDVGLLLEKDKVMVMLGHLTPLRLEHPLLVDSETTQPVGEVTGALRLIKGR